MTVQDDAKVRRLTPSAIEEVPGAIRGVELDMWQLGSEQHTWSVVEATLDDDLVVLSGEMAAPLGATGCAHPTDFTFVMRHAGDPQWSMNGHRVASTEIGVLGVQAELATSTRAPLHWLALQISPAKLDRYAQILAGAGTFPRQRENHLLAPAPGALHDLHRALVATASFASANVALFASPGVRRALQAHVAHALVRCLAPGPMPLRTSYEPIAQKAMAYLREHEKEVVYMADLCAASGVGERWLREAFHAVYGTSPMRLLRMRRLNQVHRALVSELPVPATVAAIASAYGFFDLGRFAASYRQVFGESPLETLRKRRRT